MELVRPPRPEAVLALPGAGHHGATGGIGGTDGVAAPRAVPGTVRADLGEVFRAEYPRVVGVAARVLGSRDSAEDVAQDVFLSFARSSVPAGEARGWLSVAARPEEHTSELQSRQYLVCRLLLEKKNNGLQ